MPEKYTVKLTRQAEGQLRFWVNEAEKKVQVAGIIYGRRDQRHQLSNIDTF